MTSVASATGEASAASRASVVWEVDFGVFFYKKRGKNILGSAWVRSCDRGCGGGIDLPVDQARVRNLEVVVMYFVVVLFSFW